MLEVELVEHLGENQVEGESRKEGEVEIVLAKLSSCIAVFRNRGAIAHWSALHS
jgi:hypothetical protein